MPANRITSFAPNSNTDAETLILGSMPGAESLRQTQYYAYPQNKFWRIMSELVGFAHDAPYEKRLEFLRKNKIALWDSVHACARAGSLDSNIKDVVPNDFKTFFKKHKNIKLIIFNGQAAHKLFKKHCSQFLPSEIKIAIAPSTSPANAMCSYEEKLNAWKNALRT